MTSEPERSAIAREIAQSPEAQRYVQEQREFATELKNEFQTEVANNKSILVPTRRSFVDIREEPWFWSAARPLALAAAIAVLVILGAVVLGNYKSRSNIASSNPIRGTEIVAEQTPEIASEVGEPNEVPNPLRRDVVQHIERVVIGELGTDPHQENGRSFISDRSHQRCISDRTFKTTTHNSDGFKKGPTGDLLDAVMS